MNRLVIEPVISCAPVPPRERLNFIKSLFGVNFSEGVQKAFWWMEQLTDSYVGGLWEFYRVSNGAYFMAARVPKHSGRVVLHSPSGDTVYVTEQAAGIIVTLLSLAYLSYEVSQRGENAQHLREQYQLLRQYAGEHPESLQILRAAD